MIILLYKLQQLNIACILCRATPCITFASFIDFRFKMDSTVYIQLILLCVVNIIFTFSGIILNTLAIASIWKSSQLSKKLCHFMVMVLSCFDLASVVTNHPMMLVHIISWLREDYNLIQKTRIFARIFGALHYFSPLLLLVMSIERYLGAYYPIFHRTSVTRRRLLTLTAILLIPTCAWHMSKKMDLEFSAKATQIIVIVLFLLPFIFVNFKLFIIARKVHRQRAVSSGKGKGKGKTKNFKNISTALWLVACLMLLYIPLSTYIAFYLSRMPKNTMRLSYIWSYTCATMNCTLNTFIFFWKNKVLCAEGIKILKTLKGRLAGS